MIELEYLLRIVLSVFLGFFIGLERKARFKEAGIRTHTIVSSGAALIMIVSKYGFNDMIGVTNVDATRIASQIVSGIGFIGAGMIIYRKQVVHGLTTAAGVWATAGVGMAAGAGLYIVAVGSTALLILFQCIMHIKCKLFSTKHYVKLKINYEVTTDENETVKKLFSVDRFAKLNVNRRDDKIICTATLNTDKTFKDTYINQVLRENPFIYSIERVDDE